MVFLMLIAFNHQVMKQFVIRGQSEGVWPGLLPGDVRRCGRDGFDRIFRGEAGTNLLAVCSESKASEGLAMQKKEKCHGFPRWIARTTR